MSLSHRILTVTAFVVLVSAAIDAVSGYAMVTGTVFCDQCKDGQVSLFDYPLYGIKVTMACPGGNDGRQSTMREEITNWFGNYAMRFDGTPNLSGCYAQVSGDSQLGQPNGCAAAAGPAQYLRLMFNMFGMEMYAVDPLIAQPAVPMAFCPVGFTNNPVPARPAVAPAPPPLMIPLPPPSSPRMPPVPFLEASACPYEKWMMPEYRCYWMVVSPDTKVAVVFGVLAANKYGTDMSLEQGLKKGGGGDPYGTLLREGTTALLNSYNSIQFPFHPLDVIQYMNWALMGSSSSSYSSTSTQQQVVLQTALSFMRANSGEGTNATCTFTTCK